jgi:hypothetical protein
MKKICMDCQRFVIEAVPAFPDAHGTCRRYAPRGPAIATGGWSAFPPVGAWSGCAEHQEVRPGGAYRKRVAELEAWLGPLKNKDQHQ